MAYRLVLSTSMDLIHDVSHVLLLHKYIGNPFHVLKTEEIQLPKNFNYKKKSVQILDKRIKQLRNQQIPLVKVFWKNHKVEKAAWDIEQIMREKHLKLFPVNYGDEILLRKRNCNVYMYVLNSIYVWAYLMHT